MGWVKHGPRVRTAPPEDGNAAARPDPIDVHVGDRLRRTRIFRNVSRRELARRIGATERQVRAFESGAARIDADQLESIGRVLDMSRSFLFRPSRRGRSDAAEAIDFSPRIAAPADESSGERAKQIFESIGDARVRRLLVDLMLTITAVEPGGRRLM
jgi:transcriptional regulator with XRE-family HTH domain